MQRLNHAPGARSSAASPGNDKARVVAGLVDGHGEADNPNCAKAQTERKAFATLQAQLAMRGFALIGEIPGPFTIARWDRTVECVSLDAVREFARRVGVTQ